MLHRQMAEGQIHWRDEPPVVPEVDPEKAPDVVDKPGFGYAARFPGRRQKWHWMVADANRPTQPPKTMCNLFIGGAEVAEWEKFLDGPSCSDCSEQLRKILVVYGTRPGSKLDESFKRGIRKRRHGRGKSQR